jgi:hypothetical protein
MICSAERSIFLVMICTGNWLLVEGKTKREEREESDDEENQSKASRPGDLNQDSDDDDSSIDYGEIPPLRRIRPDYIRADAEYSVTEFDFVYETNKSIILMPPDKSYPINREAVTDWVTSLQETGAPSVVVEFAQIFQANAKHISFAEFYENLVRMARTLSSKCREEQSVIWLAHARDTKKSAYWVCLMIWPYIRKHVVRVSGEFTTDESFYSKFPRVRYVFADDASYSGSQAVQRTGFWEPRAPPDVLGKVTVLIPYVTKVARELIARNDRIPPGMTIEFLYAVEFQTLSDLFPVEKIVEARKYPGFALLGNNQTMVYFDHKIPDSISNTDLIFLFGPTYIQSEKGFLTRSLISNCTIEFQKGRNEWGRLVDAPKKPKEKAAIIYNILMQGSPRIPANFEFISICPPSFQKTLVYR